MQVIIMAGGKGERLKPFTDTLPKALIPFNNKPLLDYLINHIKDNGGDNIVICAGYLGSKIQEFITKNNYGIKVSVFIEDESLGTAGPLHLIYDLLEDEFFVLYADVYTTINLKEMLQFHKKKKADVTMALHVSDHPEDSTVVAVANNNRIVKMIEKPGDQWHQYGRLTTTPLYIVKKDVINFITPNRLIDFAKDVFPQMIFHNKKLFGYITNEYAKDIGTPDRYRMVLDRLKK